MRAECTAWGSPTRDDLPPVVWPEGGDLRVITPTSSAAFLGLVACSLGRGYPWNGTCSGKARLLPLSKPGAIQVASKPFDGKLTFASKP